MKVTGKIFIADNDPVNRELLSGQLESLKCDFISARDGLDAWEHIQKDVPDLILINISLPDMDGYELCRRIKKSKRFADIPVILIGTSEESFDREKTFYAGAGDYILAPFEKEVVLSRVKTHLEHHIYQKELKILRSEMEQRIEEKTNAFKKNKAMLRGFIEGSKDAICIRDPERKLILWNQAFARGVKENCGVDITLGMRVEDYIVEGLLAGFSKYQKKLYQALQGEPQSAEFSYPCLDGITRYFHVSWFPVRVDGQIVAVAEVSRDVTENKTLEFELKNQNELFKGYMQNSTEAIWAYEFNPPMPMDLSIDDQVDYCYSHVRVAVANLTWAKSIGYDRAEDLIGLPLAEVVTRSVPENEAAIRDIAKAEYHLEGVITHDRSRQGELRISLNNLTREIRDGHLIRSWGTHRDITDQENAKLQLLEAEKRYRTVADFTFDWEYWESPDGKLIYVSPSCERITGYSTREFMEKSGLIHDIILPEDGHLWHDHRDLVDQKFASRRISFRIKKKDGTIRWIEHACLPVYDEEGSYTGIRASNRDITKRKHAEDDLQKKETLLMEAQAIANMGSWEWNIKTNELMWSDLIYDIFGISSRDFEATYDAFLNRVHPDDRDIVKQSVNSAISDPSKDYNILHRIIKTDGSERIVRERGKVKFDDTGKATFMIGTVQDVTEIKTMEAERQKLRNELSYMDRVMGMGVLTAGLAHEINQPLTAILSNAQASKRFLDNDRPDLNEVNEAIQDIISDTKRAGKIVHGIRSMLGRDELRKEKIELNDAVREILTLTRNEALKYNIVLEENLQSGLPFVNVNRIQIQQICLNLVKNALEAMKVEIQPNAKILIFSWYQKGEGVLLSVSDSGPGIKPDRLTEIFKGFHTTKKAGLGVGLAVCRSIAENHGGRIWAENRPEGGATFYLLLPAEEN